MSLLQDAMKIEELKWQITEAGDEAHQNKERTEDDPYGLIGMSDEYIIYEARYCLEKYIGGIGFTHGDEYDGDRGSKAKREAQAEVQKLKRFLIKHTGSDHFEPNPYPKPKGG